MISSSKDAPSFRTESMPRSASNSLKSKTSASEGALHAEVGGAQPLRLPVAGDLCGESGSQAALAKLAGAIAEMKAAAIAPLLDKAIQALKLEDAVEGGRWAMQALEHDELSGFGWYLLAIARERLGDFKSSIQCYESALKLLPNHAEIANDIGRLAYRLDMKEVAVKLFRHFIAARPQVPDGPNNLACALRDLNRYEEAIEVLKPALATHPAEPLLWNTLGSVLSEQGELDTAVVFFDEALRLNPDFAKARYNRGNTRLGLGHYAEALADCESAMAQSIPPDEAAMMRLARATILLCQGRIGEGWDDYEARLLPEFSGVTHFLIDRPKWTPDSDLSGKRFLLMGEQGLGDEVLFANIVPDLIEAIGPKGHLSICVEPRLVSLFQRSFPTAAVGAHATYQVDTHLVRGAPVIDQAKVDLWTPMASPLRRFRRSIEAFPDRERFLIPDPDRVAHWTEVLTGAPGGLKVGLLWKSMKLQGARQRQFSPFAQWTPVLKTPGICFINLQYGDCSEELAMAREELGVEIWTPPGIDLKQDLDDLAALSCALDLVLGFANATSNIAAAAGANVWLIAIPGAWVQAGTGRYPWYPQARVFNPAAFREWGPVMDEVAQALAAKTA
jgi:tetratricopeptide (TPR) repeat protein